MDSGWTPEGLQVDSSRTLLGLRVDSLWTPPGLRPNLWLSVKSSLNTEQERAFKIIANHATKKNADQLRMYLGGMGGTGKSQVIQALMKIF